MINNLFYHNMSKNGEKNSHHDLLQPEVDVPTNSPKPNSSLSIIKSKELESVLKFRETESANV